MSEQTTKAERDKLRELAAKATPGPWAWESTNEQGYDWSLGVVLDAEDRPMSGRIDGEEGDVDELICSGEHAPANAAYIAAANPELILRLLSDLAAAEGRGQWQPMETAPKDGTEILILLERGGVLRVQAIGGLVDSDEEETWTWVAAEDQPYPECWTEATCWEVNAEGEQSEQPIAWMPLPSAPAEEGAK